MVDGLVGLLLEEARDELRQAGAPPPIIVETAAGRGRQAAGCWRVIRARVREGGLELTVARQRELAEQPEPAGEEGE